jgi:hypothetical protein
MAAGELLDRLDRHRHRNGLSLKRLRLGTDGGASQQQYRTSQGPVRTRVWSVIMGL